MEGEHEARKNRTKTLQIARHLAISRNVLDSGSPSGALGQTAWRFQAIQEFVSYDVASGRPMIDEDAWVLAEISVEQGMRVDTWHGRLDPCTPISGVG